LQRRHSHRLLCSRSAVPSVLCYALCLPVCALDSGAFVGSCCPRLAGRDDPTALTVAAWLTLETCLKAFQRLRRHIRPMIPFEALDDCSPLGRPTTWIEMCEQGGATPLIVHVVADHRALFGCFILLVRDVKIVVAGAVPYAQRSNPLNACSDRHGTSVLCCAKERAPARLTLMGDCCAHRCLLWRPEPGTCGLQAHFGRRDGDGLETASYCARLPADA
jgi:hypothetical protein